MAAVLGRKKTTTTSYSELKDGDEFAFLDDGDDASDDIFAADVKKSGKRKDDGYVEIDSDDEPVIQPKRTTTKSKQSPAKKKGEDVEMKDADSLVMVDDSDDAMVIDKSAPMAGSKKRKSVDLESDSEEDDIVPANKASKGKSAKQPPAKKARAPKKTKEPEPESAALQAILDSIPTVRAPTPPPKDPEVKFEVRKKMKSLAEDTNTIGKVCSSSNFLNLKIRPL